MLPCKPAYTTIRRIFGTSLLALSTTWPAWSASTHVANEEPYTHSQQLVEIAPGRRINLYCTGSGSPTVVMDAGFANFSAVWRYVQPEVAQTTRVCSYDRAGEGWSDLGPFPRTSWAIVADLNALLRKAEEVPPYILVGHSFGGLNVVLYADLYPGELAGLLLVDPAVAGQDARFAEIVPQIYQSNQDKLELYRRCTDVAREGVLDPIRQMQEGCALSDPGYGPALLGLAQRLASEPKVWATLASEWAELASRSPGLQSTDTAELEATAHNLSLPLTVLQANEAPSALSIEQRTRLFELRTEMLGNLAAHSIRGEHVIVPNSGHHIQVDRPEAVIQAIEHLVSSVRFSFGGSRR
jgi:pimeloyl-ACP methyl ester carboxylesterase